MFVTDQRASYSSFSNDLERNCPGTEKYEVKTHKDLRLITNKYLSFYIWKILPHGNAESIREK